MLVLAASAGSFIALAAAKEAPVKKEITPRTVSLRVEKVRSESVTLSVETQGEIRPKTEIDLIPQVSGSIVSISNSFAEGAAFTPSTTLVEIDKSDYELAVKSAEAHVAEAAVKLEKEIANAKIKKKQWKEWVKDGDPTPLALNAHQVAGAHAQLQAAETSLNTAKLNLARTTIRVPFKGRVLDRFVGVGQFVSRGTKLGRVFATDTVEVRLPLTDNQLAELRLPIGFIANDTNAPVVKFKATLGGTDHIWKGRIVRVNPSIDKKTRLVYAIAEVDDPYGAGADNGMPLAVGLFVSATIEGTTPQNVMVLPRLALRREDQVYVIKDGALRIRTVQVVSTSEDTLYIVSGVAIGEQVVISPVLAAIDGMAAQAIVRSADTQSATVAAASR
ncbi:MAG: efflux RND transporter periplasmic adaptor subunit [Kordiimonadaceae bacterium]|nr:efflux RND transporter periplasmic adaptor subunit [Kordiimonadaceae bacterium]